MPLVLVIHGGPYFVTSGASIRSINGSPPRLCGVERQLRGSTGFGKAFVRAADANGADECMTT